MPTLWDKKQHTIVNNESSEIIRMLYTCFDDFLDPSHREVNAPGGGFYPADLRADIDAMNEWVYHDVNNGVYKVGFATNQEAYDASIYPLFSSLDRLEKHLADPKWSSRGPYLFGEHITEADIRLFTTLIRFDVAYVPIFQCNIRDIRHGYPRLSRWLRNLYWDESDRTNGGVFKKTVYFGQCAVSYFSFSSPVEPSSLTLFSYLAEIYKYGYYKAKHRGLHQGTDVGWSVILPRGPVPDIEPLTDAEEQALIHGHRRSDGDVDGITAPLAGAALEDAANIKDPENKQRSRQAYSDENKRWEKAARRAEKEAGAANLHLAQS